MTTIDIPKVSVINKLTGEKKNIKFLNEINNFKKLCSEEFSIPYNEIQITNQNGIIINNIDEIDIDSNYYVGKIVIDFTKDKRKILDPIHRISFDPFLEGEIKNLETKDVEIKEKNVKLNKKSKILIFEKSIKPNYFQKIEKKSTSKNTSKNPKLINIDKNSLFGSIKQEMVIEESSSDDENNDIMSVSTTLGKRLLGCLSSAPTYSNDIIASVDSNDSIIEDEESENNFLNINVEEGPLLDALNTLFTPFKLIDGHFPSIEYLQSQNWIKSISNLWKKYQFKIISNDNPMRIYIRNYLSNFRFSTKNWINHELKIAICGPKFSGKSQTMALISEELSLEFSVSEQWKKYFFFSLNIEEMLLNISSFEQFYKYILNLTLNTLSEQRPIIIPFISNIKKQFLSILDFSIPSKCLHPYPEITEYAKFYGNLWRNPYALENWITSIFLLPKFISNSIGIKKIIYFVDNIDLADILITPDLPFKFSPNNIFLIEHLKYVLSISNFIISCKNLKKFFLIMKPTDFGGINLLNGLSYLNTFDFNISLDNNLPDYSFSFEIKEEEKPIILSKNICGNIPIYINKWELIIKNWLKFEKFQGNDDKKEDLFLDTLSLAQEFIEMIFICSNEKHISVLNMKKI